MARKRINLFTSESSSDSIANSIVMAGKTDPTTLLARFGLSSFRPGQRDVVDAVAAGRRRDVRDADRRRKEPLLSAAQFGTRRDDDCRFAADRVDEGSSRHAPRIGNQRQTDSTAACRPANRPK